MNQKSRLRSDHSDQTKTVEFSESSYASSKEMDLKLINLWNERVNFREITYII